MRKGIYLALVLGVLACAAGAQTLIEPGRYGPLKVPGKEPDGVLWIPLDYSKDQQSGLIMYFHDMNAAPNPGPFPRAIAWQGYLIAGLSYPEVPDKGAGPFVKDKDVWKKMVAYLKETIDTIAASYSIDRRKVYLAGEGLGGWAVNYYGLHRDAADLFCGYCMISAGPLNTGGAYFKAARKKPVLVVYGEYDKNYRLCRDSIRGLQAMGADLTLEVIRGQWHGSVGDLTPQIRAWLKIDNSVDERLPELRKATVNENAPVRRSNKFIDTPITVPVFEDIYDRLPQLGAAAGQAAAAGRNLVAILAVQGDPEYAIRCRMFQDKPTLRSLFIVADIGKDLLAMDQTQRRDIARMLCSAAPPHSLLSPLEDAPLVVIPPGSPVPYVMHWKTDADMKRYAYLVAANLKFSGMREYTLFEELAKAVLDTAGNAAERHPYVQKSEFPKDLAEVLNECRQNSRWALVCIPYVSKGERLRDTAYAEDLARRYPSFLTRVFDIDSKTNPVVLNAGHRMQETTISYRLTEMKQRDSILLIGPQGLIAFGERLLMLDAGEAHLRMLHAARWEAVHGNRAGAPAMVNLCIELLPDTIDSSARRAECGALLNELTNPGVEEEPF